MKVTFRGWRRVVYSHEVEVIPVAKLDGGYAPIESRKSLIWSDGMTAFGKFNDLALSGAFLAEFKFTEAELKSWLTNFLIANPDDAVMLIARAHVDAIRHLAKSGKGS